MNKRNNKKSVKKQVLSAYLSNLKNSFNIAFTKLSKVKNIHLIIIGLLILGFWFFWTQIRPINIRRQCYSEVFTPTVKNAKWSKGKVWTILYPAYDPAKGSRFQYSFWGWSYPETDSETSNYKRCLIWRGSSIPLEMN